MLEVNTAVGAAGPQLLRERLQLGSAAKIAPDALAWSGTSERTPGNRG